MKFVLFLMGILIGNQVTGHFYSKWIHPDQIAADLAEAHYIGCIKFALPIEDTKKVLNTCTENAKKYEANTRLILRVLM